MLTEGIMKKVTLVKKKFASDDPFEICRAMKITLLQTPMGSNPGSCKGFFILNARRKVIAINSELPEHVQRIILAHELGHAVLHTREAICTFHDISILNEANRLEYEANMFATELLLDNAEVQRILAESEDFFTAAAVLGVPPEILDFKMRTMQRQGYRVAPPLMSKSNFLKRDISGDRC